MFYRLFLLIALTVSLPAQAVQQGDTLPDSVLQTLALDNEKLTIIDFFAEWCVSCREELPEVNQLSKELEDTGVTFLGIDVDEDVEVGKAFQRSLGIEFPVINDDQQKLADAFKPIGMPALYYVYQGQVIKMRFGAINHIRDVIIKDLAEMGVEL